LLRASKCVRAVALSCGAALEHTTRLRSVRTTPHATLGGPRWSFPSCVEGRPDSRRPQMRSLAPRARPGTTESAGARSVAGATRSDRPSAAEEEHDRQDQAHDEQYPGDVGGGARNAGEAEHPGNQRHDEEDHGPVQHALSFRSDPSTHAIASPAIADRLLPALVRLVIFGVPELVPQPAHLHVLLDPTPGGFLLFHRIE